MEEWRDVVGYEGLYRVSNLGKVMTVSRVVRFGSRSRIVPSIILTPLKGDDGHLKVSLSKSSKMTHRYIHQLVLEAFVGLCPEGMQCCHFPDRDPANNRLENLRWGTPLENRHDSIVHGTSPQGEKNPQAKLSDADVRLIRELRVQGLTMKSIADRFGVTRTTVGDILNKRTWCHVQTDYIPAPNAETGFFGWKWGLIAAAS